jgi:hypothetical protein
MENEAAVIGSAGACACATGTGPAAAAGWGMRTAGTGAAVGACGPGNGRTAGAAAGAEVPAGLGSENGTGATGRGGAAGAGALAGAGCIRIAGAGAGAGSGATGATGPIDIGAAGAAPFCRAKLVVATSFFSKTRSGASLSPLAPNKSGTSLETSFRAWSGRRERASGCICARISASGRSTSRASSAAELMNTPDGALRRSSPKLTFTAPWGNCSKTLFRAML